MAKATEHFDYKEFECKCGCGGNKIQLKLIQALEKLREKVGKPIIINSGYRCEAHNKAVGGVPNSQHTKGTASDIRVNGVSPKELAKLAEEIPEFKHGGIGTYNSFVHVDIRGHKARWRG